MSLDQPFGTTDDFYEGELGLDVKYKLRHFSKFKILLAAAIILALLCGVFIALYAVEKSRLSQTVSPTVTTAQPPQLCTGLECVATAYDVIQQLNQSVDPCQNFYEYACGGWLHRNALKPGQTYKTGLSMVSEKNYDTLKKAMEEAPLRYKTNEAVMKAYQFYNACINEDVVNARGDAPLKQFIRDYGGWHVTPNVSVSATPFLKRLAKINRELTGQNNERPLLGVSVSTDPHNSSANIMQLDRAQTGMQKSYYLGNTSDSLKVQQAYKQYMLDVAVLLGAEPSEARVQMMQVYEFETKLAKIENSVFGGYTVREMLKQAADGGSFPLELRMTIEQFANISNIPVGTILEFIQDVFLEQGFKFSKDNKILAYPSLYFQKVIELYLNQTKMDSKVLDNYAMWSAISYVQRTLSSNYSAAYTKFVSAIVGNQTQHRWKLCLQSIQSTALKMPLGLLFVDKAFAKESRASMQEMTRHIRESFINNLDGFSWMDKETKEQAKQKALAIEEDVGYPDYIKDPVKLAQKTQNLKFGDKLFENVLALIKFTVQSDLAELKQPANRDKWMLGPSQTNGYYSPAQNRIVFLAGILQPPFFNPKYPKYLNYGGMGMVIGHEITHGFDGTGRMFDKDGNLRNWWTPMSSANFQVKSQCLVKQYDTFTAFGRNLNGTSTLNENIADNGGIKIAYDGYNSWVRANKPEGALPGLGLTVDQLFFVGFARPWCSIYTRKPALLQLKTDSHSFPKYRVLGPLQNDPTFAEAFKCKPAAPMNPAKKCAVW